MVLDWKLSIHFDQNLAGFGGWNTGRAIGNPIGRLEDVIDSVESTGQFEPNSLELLLLFVVRVNRFGRWQTEDLTRAVQSGIDMRANIFTAQALNKAGFFHYH